ncbi:MAG: ATP-binding protein [Bacteroidota bacterium]|nr:ATP-binding protein [Bacteroidota bacterium]
MNFERSHKSLLLNRLVDEKRQFVQVVFGPRQVGKTTMIVQVLKETDMPSHYMSADGVSSDQQIWISQQWEIARLIIKQSEKNEGLLIFDEIQKIENWSEVVKREWDLDTMNGTGLKVVLLGSSRILLQQGLTESLAGRYETTYMGHWSFSEMQEAFGYDIDQFIWFGGYPGAASMIKDENRWKQYVLDSLIEASISRDILMLTRVDKPALMRRLFVLGCQYSGQILSFNKILGQLLDAGNTTTLSNYLNLLDTAGLLNGIEKYSPDLIRQRSSSPKFQVYNTALMSAQNDLTFQEVKMKPDLWGRWVESAVGAHLINSSRAGYFTVHYWRDHNDEVDFVLQYRGKVIAIEVKSGARAQISGMEAFKKKFPQCKVFLIGASGLPVSQFLQTNPTDLF